MKNVPSSIIRLSITKVVGSNMLAGKAAGQKDFPLLLAAIREAPDSATVALDWSEVEIATASYFGATLMPLIRMAISGDLDRYFVIVGMNESCLDELRLVLDLQSHAVLVGEFDRHGRIGKINIVGKIDPSHILTFTSVAAAEAISATELYLRNKAQGQSKIGKTGWINRVNTLYRERLLRRKKIGREFVFEVPI